MRALALAALVAVPVSAQAVYSWEDADGVHYTDDISQVPKKHRKQGGTTFDERPPVGTVSVPEKKAPTAKPVLLAQNSKMDERAWRERFVTANRRITTIERSIEALKISLPARTECSTLVPITGRVDPRTGHPIPAQPAPPVIDPYGNSTVITNCQPNREYDRIIKEIELKRVELKDARTDLEQLEREASYDGVPREWRRGW